MSKHKIEEKHTINIVGIYDSNTVGIVVEDEVKSLKDLFQSFNNKEVKISISIKDEIW